MDDICGICENGKLTYMTESNEVEFKGHKRIIPTHYSICNTCYSNQANSDQMKLNKMLMIEFKNYVNSIELI